MYLRSLITRKITKPKVNVNKVSWYDCRRSCNTVQPSKLLKYGRMFDVINHADLICTITKMYFTVLYWRIAILRCVYGASTGGIGPLDSQRRMQNFESSSQVHSSSSHMHVFYVYISVRLIRIRLAELLWLYSTVLFRSASRENVAPSLRASVFRWRCVVILYRVTQTRRLIFVSEVLSFRVKHAKFHGREKNRPEPKGCEVKRLPPLSAPSAGRDVTTIRWTPIRVWRVSFHVPERR